MTTWDPKNPSSYTRPPYSKGTPIPVKPNLEEKYWTIEADLMDDTIVLADIIKKKRLKPRYDVWKDAVADCVILSEQGGILLAYVVAHRYRRNVQDGWYNGKRTFSMSTGKLIEEKED